MSYKLTQTGQEVQALLNQIKNGGQSQVTDAVLYSEQALNEKEQAQARKNIGATSDAEAVLYSKTQNLKGDQQAQARANIGAAGTEQLPTKVSELENDAGYTTNKGTVTQIQINNDTFTPDANGKVDCGDLVDLVVDQDDFTWPGPLNLISTFCGKLNLFDAAKYSYFPPAQNVWTVDGNVYFLAKGYNIGYSFKLDKRTFSWFVAARFDYRPDWNAYDVWTDGTNTYLSYVSEDSQTVYNDVWNKGWKTKTWKGFTPWSGAQIWHANGEIYFANSHYLTKDDNGQFTDTWAPKTWGGLTEFDGTGIWTDGSDTYYSDSNGTWRLDAATSTWTQKIWEGFMPVAGNRIWTDGRDVYYSYIDTHYVLNKNNNRWEPKKWDGIEYFSATDIWTDGESIYCSPSGQSYVLNSSTGSWIPKNSSALNTTNWETDAELENGFSIVRDLSEVSGWVLSAPQYLLVVDIDNIRHSFVSVRKTKDTSDSANIKTGLVFIDTTLETDFFATFTTSGASMWNSTPKQLNCSIRVPEGAQSVTLVGLYPAAESCSLPRTMSPNSDIVVYVKAEQELFATLIPDPNNTEDLRLMFGVNPQNPPTQVTGYVSYTVVALKTPGSGYVSTIQGSFPHFLDEEVEAAVQLAPKALPQSATTIQVGELKSAQWGHSVCREWNSVRLNSELIGLGKIFAWGKDKFVATGVIQGENVLLYSYDGIAWYLSDAPSREYTNIIHDGNRFIATYTVNSSTQGSYSLDGISWHDFENFTDIPKATSKTLCYGNGKYVLATEYQSTTVPYRVYHSTDGETWTEGQTSSPGYDSIIYGNGVFVGVNRPDHIDYSTDGENWSASTFPVSSINFTDMAYENGKFVIIPDSSLDEHTKTRVGYVSADGITWTEMAMPDGQSQWNNGGWLSIIGGNGVFVAITEFYATTSTDGEHWTYPQRIWSNNLTIAYGGGVFITETQMGVSSYSDAFYTLDWRKPGIYYWDTRLHNTYTIEDENVLHNSDVLFEISDPCKITSFGVEAGKIILACDKIPTHNISYRYKATHTDQKGQLTVINHYIPDSSSFVSVEKQTLTEVQQAQVRQNIGAGVSNFSGDYNDLINVPTIPTKVSELENDSGFTNNIGTITQIKINGEVKEPKPSGLIDLGHITPEPTDWTTVPITTALENGKTYVVKLDTTPYPLTAIFTMSEALDAIDANVVGGTQQGTDGASTYELQSATITVTNGKLTGLKSTNLVSNANPGAANLAYSESTFADLGITQYHYIELLNSVGGGMSGKGVNYTAIKDTLAIDKWTTDEIHVEGEILPTTETILMTFDDTVQHTIDKTKENTLLIGHATADELKNIGYWAFDGQSLVVNAIPSTNPDTNAPLQVLFSETTDTYFKYLYQESNTTLATLYVYKSNYDTYTAGDVVLILSAEVVSGIDWLKFSTLIPASELNEFPAVKFYGYEFPSDLTGTSITIDVLCTKTDSPDIRKTLLLPYMGSEEIGSTGSGVMVHLYVYEPTTEEEAQAFPMYFMAQVLTSNAPGVAPAGTIVVNGGSDSSGSDPKYVFAKLFSLTTSGMAPVTYTYSNENIKLESAIKVYLNDSENIQIIDRQEGYVQFKRAKVADIPFSMEILDTEEEGLLRLFNSYKEPIPTKLSQFQNDTKYLTKRNIDYRSPIQVSTSPYDDDDIEIRIRDDYDVALAQYSGYPQTGTLDVDSWVEVSDGYTYTINDSGIFNDNTDVVMTVNSPIMLEAVELARGKFKIKAKSKPTEPIQYTYKSLATRTDGQLTIVNNYIPTMPTKVSELENDSGYITQLVTETLQGTKRYKTFEDLTDCVLEAGQYDAEGKYVYCV